MTSAVVHITSDKLRVINDERERVEHTKNEKSNVA